MADLRSFTRELMKDAERDLGTSLDWIAVDHWNTDNPHIHVLVRGRTDDGQDLVISRDYISSGLPSPGRGAVTLELGLRSRPGNPRPRSRRRLKPNAGQDSTAYCKPRSMKGAGVIDFRPEAGGEDHELRSAGGTGRKTRAAGACRTDRTGTMDAQAAAEETLRDLSIRGDIIKTMHRAMSGRGGEPDVSGFALHAGTPADPILGRLVDRGLHDELKGTAYAVIEGLDGRTHHIRFANLELTGDAGPGAIVETRLMKTPRVAGNCRWRSVQTSPSRNSKPRAAQPG